MPWAVEPLERSVPVAQAKPAAANGSAAVGDVLLPDAAPDESEPADEEADAAAWLEVLPVLPDVLALLSVPQAADVSMTAAATAAIATVVIRDTRFPSVTGGLGALGAHAACEPVRAERGGRVRAAHL